MGFGGQPSSKGSRGLFRQEREKPYRDLSVLGGVDAGFSIQEWEAGQLGNWRTCRRGETCWDEQRGGAGVGLAGLGTSGLGLVWGSEKPRVGTGRGSGGDPVLLAEGQVDGGGLDHPREARPSWVLKLKVKDEGLGGDVRERLSILRGPTRAVVATLNSQLRS